MKVYFVVKEPSERTINHFVSSLGKNLQKQGCEVVYGLERLWTDEVLECDIVHFQWPEYIFGSQKRIFTDDDINRTENRLLLLKEKGIKIFAQVHNLKPHTNEDKNVLRLYELLYQHSDVMVHMGQYSRDRLQPRYPYAHHVVIPHHIYDNVLPFSVSKQEARRRLHLPQNKKIILSFGKFRNDQERNFVLNVKKQIEALSLKAEANSKLYTLNSTLFLLPGFYRETLHTLNPKKFITRLYHTLRYKLKGIQFSNDVIPDDLMQCYFCAADVVLIQRLDALNSGNLPIAFAAGKVVVGPDVGNVGEILRNTGNLVFDSNNMDATVQAVQEALIASETDRGSQNRKYAEEYWSSEIIAKAMIENYKKTIK